MGIWSGVMISLIILLLLQLFGVIPKWWYSDVSNDIQQRTSVIDQYIDKFYWKDDVTDEQLAAGAAKGMVAALGDKYSTYYTEEEYKEAMNGVNGDYTGIGVSLRMDQDTKKKTISEVQAGKPADKAGVKAGDILLKIDGKDVSSLSLSETAALIKGEEGKKVVFTISRTEKDTTVEKEITVTTEKIVTQSVSHKMLDDKIGYIQIMKFDKETVSQYETALKELKEKNVQAMIVDVRNNGGGSLEACIDILDQMLPAGDLITEQIKNKEGHKYKSTDEKHFDKPVAILINGSSASASEVYAGTMQDRGAASLVGVTSYGKGIVQSLYSLEKSCGGGLKLTTGEYLLPSGRSIHGKGLTPDVEVKYNGTSNKLGAEDDNQLAKAKEIILAKLS